MKLHPLYFTIFSFIAVIIGTVSHEFGHYIVAKFYGCDATIHYAYTSYENCPLEDTSLEFDILSTLGGPLFTLFESVTAIIILLIRRASFNPYIRLAWVYVAFFCGRALINFTISFANGILNHKSVFGYTNDEVRLSHYLNLWEGFIPLVAVFVSSFLCLYVMYRFVYKHYPLPQFIVYSFFGGALGIYLWIYSLGQYILP